MPSAPVRVSPCEPRMTTPALAGSEHRATTRASATARRRLFRLTVRNIFGALGLTLFPARNTGRGPRREQFCARRARQKPALILYIIPLIQLLRFPCDLLFPSLLQKSF